MKKLFYLSLLLVLFLIPSKAFAVNEVNIYFFHRSTCNICEQERIYLEALKERYPNIRVYSYEVTDNDNYNLMQEAKKLFNEERSGVPFTVIGDKPHFGFNQSMKGLMQKEVYTYSKTSYQNKLGEKLNINYRTDLEGEVVEYKENSDYVIEETSGKPRTTTSTTDTDSELKKYMGSIILISSGLILFIVYIMLSIVERKRGRI